MNSYLDNIDDYGFNCRNRHTYKKSLITKNMSVVLETLLLSFKEKDGKLLFLPDEDQLRILSTLCYLDIVDCYERLGIDNTYFAQGISDKSKGYVIEKMLNLRKKYRSNKNGK